MTIIPAPTARFRPRADAATLSTLVREAWAAYGEDLARRRDAANVGEVVAAYLEARYPADDMAVLERYGQAKKIDGIRVRVHNPETSRWDHVVAVDLPRPVLTPGEYGAAEVYCRGPRFSEMEGYGLTPAYLAEVVAKGELEAYLEDHRAREAARLPREVEPYFLAAVEGQNAYLREYRAAANFTAVKGDDGRYPTWSEIEARFPVLGGYLAKMREGLRSAA